MTFRDRIEVGFEAWGHFVFRHRWATIAILLLFSGALISQLPKLTLDTSTEGFLHPEDPILLVYDEFRDQFERDDRILMAIHTDRVFDLQFLARLRDFHHALESELPHLAEVNSLINARNTRGEEDELVVEDLLEDWPADEAALRRIEGFALENPLYRNLLISEDLRYTTVSVELATYTSADEELDLAAFDETDASGEPSGERRSYLSGEENDEAVAALDGVIARFEGPGFEISSSGPPLFNARIASGMNHDMRRFLVLAFIATGLFLFALFRRPSGTLLPLFVVLLSLLTTLGLVPLMGISIQLPTQILPAFLMAVGVGDSVHILAIFYQQLRRGMGKEDAVAFSLGHSGLAVLMTTATTAGALLSFVAAELAPIARLGILAPIGVTLALIYTLALLPALLAVFPIREDRPGASAPMAFLDRLLVGFGNLSTRRPWAVVAVFSAVLIWAALGAAQLRFSHNPLGWFPTDHELPRDTLLLNRELRGAITMEVLFDTGRENGLQDPALLRDLDEIEKLNETLRQGDIYVGKTISLVDILKEINQALNENRPEFYAIPRDRLLVAQELLLFENSGSDDLEDVVDSQFRVGRMTLKLPWTDAIAYPDFIETVKRRYGEIVGDAAEITVTGRVPLLSRTFKALVRSMARSYVIAFLVIAPLMILLLASFKWGLVSMIPNLTPILITLGVMGWFDFPLDGFTLLIGSVAIGLAVDDTIHFMHNFRRNYDRGGSAREAVLETLQTTGQALLFTTLVLCTGFFIFMLGTMRSVFAFGFLTGLALALAFLADVALASALVTLVARRGRRRASPESQTA
ncbi:efflux RND transporter permease subunit [bacterium]|nr:efflux RND transporter permease subunit [bacterium]